jgi:hypothetical protein
VGKKLRGSSFLQRRPGASREPSQKAASRSFQKRFFCFETAFLGNRSQTFVAPQLVDRFQMFNALVRSLHMSSKYFSIIFGAIWCFFYSHFGFGFRKFNSIFVWR